MEEIEDSNVEEVEQVQTYTDPNAENTEDQIIGDGGDDKKRLSNYKFIRNSSGSASLYITALEKDKKEEFSIEKLKEMLPNLNLESTIHTEYGLIINLLNDKPVQKILQLNLANVFGFPVQAVSLFSGHYKKLVTFTEIPWCICIKEIENCLRKQNIEFTKITREKLILYIEVTSYTSYIRLKEEGINFYDSVVFQSADDVGLNDEIHYNTDNVIQCFRCQDFWHTANTCKQKVRCVRCGEEHQVKYCNRPKSSPICCNCKGPHHAAYRLCPVRLKIQNSVRVSFTFEQQ